MRACLLGPLQNNNDSFLFGFVAWVVIHNNQEIIYSCGKFLMELPMFYSVHQKKYLGNISPVEQCKCKHVNLINIRKYYTCC